jgi:hypothetical protein
MDNSDENQIVGMADRIVKLWPILALLVGGIIGYLKMTMIVDEVKADQVEWKKGSEARREKSHAEMDSLQDRVLTMEIIQECRDGKRNCK